MNIDQIGMFLEHQGLSDATIDDFFEHHGVKGQKWGVRKQKIRAFGQRHEKGLKIAGGSAAIAAGAVAAGLVLRRNRNLKIAQMARTSASLQETRRQWLSLISDLSKGGAPKEHMDRVFRDFGSFQTRHAGAFRVNTAGVVFRGLSDA